MENNKERDRNSSRVCIREKGKKLKELIGVHEKCKRRQQERKRYENEKERDRNSLRECMREKGKKLGELMRV